MGWVREGVAWSWRNGLLKTPVLSSVWVVGVEVWALLANRRLRKSNGELSDDVDEVEGSALALPLFSFPWSAAKTVATSIKAVEDHNKFGNMVKERRQLED